MFDRFFNWIKEVIKMLTPNNVKSKIGVDIAINTPMLDALRLWAQMYENKSPWLNRDVKSMGLAAAIASEVANMVTVEMTAEVKGGARAEFLNKQMETVIDKMRDNIEYAEAKGGIIFKPYVVGDVIAVDFVQADMFYPVAFDGNGKITSAVFADQKAAGDKYYTRLEYHGLKDGIYFIQNSAYRSTSKEEIGSPVDLAVLPEWAELEPYVELTGVERPLFGYYRVPLANTIDTKSPLGVSRYSRAVDLIQQADVQWSNLLWEFESGQRALYADELAFEIDKNTGKRNLPHRRLYRTLKTSGNVGGHELFEEWTPTLREANILKGLDAILKRVEYSCGLAYGTLSDPNTVDRTATEIRSSKQRTYVTVTGAQKALSAALAKLAPAGEWDAVYHYDDSVLMDKGAEAQLLLQEMSAGVVSKIEYRMFRFGESEEAARAALALVSSEQQPEPMFAEE